MIYLGWAWYASFTRKNIFQSFYKWILLPSALIFLMDIFVPADSLRFLGATSGLVFCIFCVLGVIISYVGNCLLFSKIVNYYNDNGKSELQAESDYLEHTYRILDYNNRVSYHYDARMNLYIVGMIISDAGSTWFNKEDKDVFACFLKDFYKYFKDFGMGYEEMNEENLEVFKMYNI